jgi:hypothetical protein
VKAGELISLFYPKAHARLGELVIDAVIKEGHELKAKVSEHPTESGSSFCDHVSLEPTTLQIEGIISNTPLTFVGLTAIRSFDNYLHDRSNDLAGEAFKKLESIFAKREPICIVTSLKEYKNMVLENLSVERGGGTSESFHFRASAKQIRIAKQATIAIPEPKAESVKPKQNLGKQESKPASAELSQKTVEKRSLLSSMLGWGK